MHLRGEHLHPAAARSLGPRHRDVGVPQHDAGRIGAPEGDAHARRQRDIPPRYPERLRRDSPREPFGEIDDFLCAHGALDQHRELIAAPADDGLMRRDGRAQPPGRLRDQQIAAPVADRVVHRGEPVEVHEDHASLGGAAVGGREGAVGAQHGSGAFLQVGAVGQAGQPVVEGEVRHLPAQRHLIAHVAGRDQQLIVAAGAAVRRHGRLDVPPGAVRGPHPAGEPAGRPGRPRQRGGHGPPTARPVLRVDELGQPGAEQAVGGVPELGDRGAGVADGAVGLADEHGVAGVVRELAEAPPRLQRGPRFPPAAGQDADDPRGQRDRRRARHDDQDGRAVPAGQRPGADGHRRRADRARGRDRRARRRRGPGAARSRPGQPRREAEHAERREQ